MATARLQDNYEFDSSQRLTALVADVNTLGSLPDIAYRLESALESPASTIADLATLLSFDPDLCARLLRMANSGFYSFPIKIDTIDRAICAMGMGRIRELMPVTPVADMPEDVSISPVKMRSFWEHSVAVGVFSRAIARYMGVAQCERYYIPGLLHDIGRLVMYVKLPVLISDLVQQGSIDPAALFLLEEQQLGFDHAAIGGELLEYWKVPQSIYEPVSCHHDPLAAGEFLQAACVVHIADAWINRESIGSVESSPPVIERQALDQISITEADLAEIWLTASEEVFSIVRRFSRQ